MNYTQKKSSCKLNFTQSNQLSNILDESITENRQKKELRNEAFVVGSGDALLVNTEVCWQNPQQSPKLRDIVLPNFVAKFVRKHTATYCMTTDGIEQNENAILRKFGTRLATCNSKINDFIEPKTIDIKEQNYENGKSRHITGVIKCGSPWICPSCSATLSMKRGEQLKHMVECGREHGRGYGMAVLTVPHQPDDALLSSQDVLNDIWRKAQQNTSYKNWKKENNTRFTHRGYEIMASIKNGKPDWHPHFNIIYDYDFLPSMTEEEKKRKELDNALFLWKIFNSIAKKHHGIELKKPFFEEVIREYKGDDGTFFKTDLQVKGGVSFNFDFVEEYTTKFGLVEEATAGQYKNGKGSFHPFQILDMVRKEDETMTKKEKIILIGMFREYALATKGKSFFRFAPKSLEYYQDNYGLELNVLDDEAEIQATEAQGDVIYSCEVKLWKLFSPNSLHLANLLMKETAQEMEDYIFKIINERCNE